MIKNKVSKNNRGIALISVILFCSLLITMLGVLYHNTKHKSGTQDYQYDSTKALMAANIAVQLAVYKYRVLTSEYYKINELELDIISKGSNAEASEIEKLEKAKKIWLNDLRTDPEVIDNLPGDSRNPTLIIRENIKNFIADNKNLEFGVDSFNLISSDDDGYTKDYIKIKAWGSCDGVRKDIEELIETSIVRKNVN